VKAIKTIIIFGQLLVFYFINNYFFLAAAFLAGALRGAALNY
jgi:hypothetical protein